MARVNVGVTPSFISDQHLIAESVEITMITGGLKKNDCKIKSEIPNSYHLGVGHINFFKNKLIYLKRRLEEVNIELSKREIRTSTVINLNEFPINLQNDWSPKIEDSMIVRERIIERLIKPLRAKIGFHKYYKGEIKNINDFCNSLRNSKLNDV